MPVAGSGSVSASPAVAAAVSAVPDPTAAAGRQRALGWIRRQRWWIWRQEHFKPRTGGDAAPTRTQSCNRGK